MRFNKLLIIASLQLTLAQRWQVHKSCDNSEPDKIRAAVSQAIEFSRTAVKVLNSNGDHDKVKNLMEYTVGAKDTDLKTAKASMEGKARYNSQETTDVDLTKQGMHTDVVFVCTGDHLKKLQDKPLRVYSNEFTGATFRPLQDPEAFDCFDPEKTEDDAPNAITRLPELLHNNRYQEKVAANAAAGLPPPNKNDFRVPLQGKVTTIDLCAWWLRDTYSGQDRWATITDETIVKLLDPKEFEDIEDNLNVTPMDLLLWTMSATINHELSHTRLGTFTEDVDDGVNDCYGWACILILRNPVNADSLTAGEIGLWLFDKGYYVNEDGQILKL